MRNLYKNSEHDFLQFTFFSVQLNIITTQQIIKLFSATKVK